MDRILITREQAKELYDLVCDDYQRQLQQRAMDTNPFEEYLEIYEDELRAGLSALDSDSNAMDYLKRIIPDAVKEILQKKESITLTPYDDGRIYTNDDMDTVACLATDDVGYEGTLYLSRSLDWDIITSSTGNKYLIAKNPGGDRC